MGALLFGEERNREVAKLNRGDWVEFEATMAAHGHHGDPEVMTLWHVGVVDRPAAGDDRVPSTDRAEEAAAARPLGNASHGGRRGGEPASRTFGAESGGDGGKRSP